MSTAPRQSIRPTGDLDLASAPTVLAPAQIRNPNETVTLDLSEVTFIDAAGLGNVVRLNNVLLGAGGHLHITQLGPQPARVFRIGGLSELLRRS